MAIKIPGLPELRLHSPYWQNVNIGLILGLTAGLYTSLNLLGAGGGKPNSFQTVQVVNATLCGVYFFSSCLAGSVLNTIGPAFTACAGVIGFILYVGSLWYFDATGQEGFPIFAGVAVGISAGLIWVVQGYIGMSYSEEEERGAFITSSFNLYATGAAIGGLIALIINRNSTEAAGVPAAVYIVFMVMQGVGACMAFLFRPPSKIIRDDGTTVANIKSRGFIEELKSNLEIFRDWKLLMMVPAFLPAECFLVYNGSVNAYHNNLRTRSLLSFIAVVLQIPCGVILQKLLDHKAWGRRTRAFIGLTLVGIPLMGTWIWEIVRTRNYNRVDPPTPLDWSDDGFVAIFFLFVLNWVSSSLWNYVIMYFLGCFTNSPRKAANYAGVYRGFLAAGEAICFGLDSIAVPYVKEAGVLFCFYATGLLILIYLAFFHIKETKYFADEDGVVVPVHVLKEHAHEVVTGEEPHGNSIPEVSTVGKAIDA